MSRIKASRILIVTVILFSFNLLYGCGSQDTVPFNHGDYFEYMKADKGYKKIYRIDKGEDEMFRITWEAGVSDPDEFIVDRRGKIVETPSYVEGSLAKDLFYERQMILWLPTSKRKVGEEVYFCDFLGKNAVIEERKWKKWDVWVARHSNVFGWQENYFDKETGFLVGSQTEEGDSYVLYDTNVEMTK